MRREGAQPSARFGRPVGPKRLPTAACIAVLLLAGCGDEQDDAGSTLVDPDRKPLINSLSVTPGGEELLLTTNRGFFRIEDGEASRIAARVRAADGSSPLGRFLAVSALPDGRLIGSGHPERKRLAPFLGLIRSTDRGRSWQVVSRYGFTDLHVLRLRHGNLYAFDAVLPAFLIRPAGGGKWSERPTPPDLVLDFVVDPEDPDHLLASTADAIFDSTDQARSWRASSSGSSPRLAWPAADALYRADQDGLVYRGENGGWQLIGRIDGEPWKLEAVAAEDLYAALADGAIVHSEDGGRNWEEVFAP